MKKTKLKDNLTGILCPVIFGLVVFVLWQFEILHALLKTNTFTLPLPSRIVTIIMENMPKMILNTKATVTVAVAGLILGSLFGYLIAIFAALAPKWGTGGLRIVAAFNAVPIVALAPVITNLTKDVSKDASVRSMVAKILVVTLFCTASMSITAYRGLTELRPFSLDLLKTYAANKATVFLKLRLPNSVPYIFTALRVSVPASIISALVSEYFAEYIIGLGRQIRENIVQAQYTSAWSYIAVACLIGILFYLLLLFCERLILKDHSR
ncbi:MAG: ABC transporter permease subunit [Lachnospiraceae bacterium]|jgi:NitT/TauT family transport system permease protein|nr:ABC transporter permease subunit [Lachnospiraceae bacterium]